MFFPKAHSLPGRVIVGAYVLHTGLDKWHGNEQLATAVHGMASGAYPVFKDMAPARFLRLLAGSEIAVGGALLVPFVPNALAGAGLTGFSGALLTMYLRTPSMHKPGSVWPSQTGIAVSKDSWMLAVGLGLLVDAWSARRR